MNSTKFGPRPVSVISTDAGAHWEVRTLSEPPLSLFFLNEDLGWMVTSPHPWENRIWHTTDGGLTWRGLPPIQPQITHVYFADAKHGWAIGSRRTVLETVDAGQTWKPAAGAQADPSFKYDVAYEWITFANPLVGLIVGWEKLPGAMIPVWMDPESSVVSKKSHLSYELSTADGGVTWKTSLHNLTGHVVRVRFGPDGRRVDLVDNIMVPPVIGSNWSRLIRTPISASRFTVPRRL